MIGSGPIVIGQGCEFDYSGTPGCRILKQEGIRLLDRPAFSVQYHPEAAPGPHDAVDHFDQFCALMDGGK